MREVGTSVFAAATIVCSDDPPGALREAGDLMDAVAAGVLSPDSVTELGALPGLEAEPPASRRGVTVFKSVGSAAADLAVLDLLLHRARAEPGIHGFDFAE
jgi:ornithine cyclodeaminase/alanine dehydrogenase-like protein (mu-crystallin family)